MDEEAKKKRKFQEASKKIRQAINIIKGNTEFKDFSSPTLPSSRDDILSYIHDNKLEKLELNIKPKQFVCLSTKSKNIIKDMEGLKNAVKEFIDKDSVGWIGFQFDCNPDILSEKSLELTDLLSYMHALYRSHEMLLPYQNMMDAFDIAILDELEGTIDNILKVVFDSLMAEHQISFSSTKTSRYILRELENKLLGCDTIHKLLIKLSSGICERLIEIQKKVFLES